MENIIIVIISVLAMENLTYLDISMGQSGIHVDANGLPDMDRYNFTEDERNYLYSLENQQQYISEFEHFLALKRGETFVNNSTSLITQEYMWENSFTMRRMLTDKHIFTDEERHYLMSIGNCSDFVSEHNRLVKMVEQRKGPNNITGTSSDLKFVDVMDCLTPGDWFSPEEQLPEVFEEVDYSWLDNYDDDAPIEIYSNQEHQKQEEEARGNRRRLRLAIAAAKANERHADADRMDEQGWSGEWDDMSCITPPQRSCPTSRAPVKRSYRDEEDTPVCKKSLVARKLDF